MPPRQVPPQTPIQNALKTSVIINRIDQVNQIPWTEWRAPIAFGCPAAPYSVVMTGAGGKIDPCLLPASSGPLIEVNGTPVTDQSVLNFVPQTGIAITFGPTGEIYIMNTGASSTSFTDITSGVNTQATMVVGTGASLSYTGGGVVDANEIGTINVDGNLPTHAGMVLISQPGNTAAIWADPQVQGLYPAGSSAASPPVYAPPTTIQPVLVGGVDDTGKTTNLLTTPAGAVVTVSEAQAYDADFFAWNSGSQPTLIPSGALTPLLSISPQSTATAIFFFLTGLDIWATPAILMWQLIKNGTLTGASFANVPNSNARQDTAATSIAGGTIVDTGYSYFGTRTNAYELSFGIPGGTPDIFTLVVAKQLGPIKEFANAALRWSEQTLPL